MHLQINHTIPGARLIVSLDMAKTFDSVDWHYMSTVPRHMGFGEVFLTWILLLYRSPKATIKIGMSVSEQFSVGRGTRHGCPLSLAMFALAIEPIAIALRASTEVKALEVGGIRECMSLYADHMLLFLEDPGPSLEAVFEILCTFAKFSGLRVNWEKSNIMAIHDGAQAQTSPLVPIAWVSEVKYLGVRVTPKVTDYLQLNLMPILTKVKIQLDAWKHLPFSLIDRVDLIKIKILPVFLYFLRNTPIWVPCSFFGRANSLFRSFLWGLGHPKVGLRTLQEPYGQGGLALPDLFK